MSAAPDTADYVRLKQAYFEWLELDAAARAARLAQLEREDAALAAALRRQLDAAGLALPLLDRVAAPPSGPTLPHYTVLRELGRGGMGVVWLAERALGDARQTVALKQILHAHWSEDDRRRFERERRILAALDHPNIASLVDGGNDALGTPFLSTQFVEGMALDRWCEQHAAGLVARVRLLRDVAAAVGYAHSRLVVHRDLKPANILVTAAGVPKLLDFGIARALHESPVTIEGPSQMTLRYAAPEQVASDGAVAGVGVDLYALGALLYELSARASPYGETAGPAALLQAILHAEPAAPSSRPAALTGADRDLDAICLKLLRKDPSHRYLAAGELVADLDRWLAREPVEARRGERGYRLRALLRRRWRSFALFGALLLAAAAFAAYEVRSTRAQLAAVALERDKARAITQFFEELFASATPNEVREGKISARELLQRSAARLDEGVTAQFGDDARAGLYRAAGGVMVRQDLLPEAAAMLDRAIALWRTLPQPPRSDLAGALHERARIAFIQGQVDAAIEGEQAAVDLLLQSPEADPSTLAALLNGLAVMQWSSGHAADAARNLERAAGLLRASLPEGRVYYANNLRNLAMFQLYAGDAAAALDNAREAVAQASMLRPERTRDVLLNQVTLGSALRELGRYGEADAIYREVEARLRREVGPNSMDLADALNARAKQWLLQQRWDEAAGALREVEAIHVANGGPTHPRALAARADQALVALGRGRWSQAEAILRDVARLRADGGAVEASTLAAERVALAHAACRAAAAPEPGHIASLQAGVAALQRNPTLPYARLAQARDWLAECAARVAAR